MITSTFVLVEMWLLQSKMSFAVAESFANLVRSGAARLERTTAEDLQYAWEIATLLQDQRFSLVDQTSFAMMERLGAPKTTSFDDNFIIYRFGPGKHRAFEVLR